jgi:NDP-sugar pyrophosphorylase family protein
VREITTQVPYGVIEIQRNLVSAVHEKPIYTDLVSAGVYCLSPEVLDLIESSQIDMPEVINSAIAASLSVGAYPIHREWIDIGNPRDLQRANNAVENVS